MKGVDRILLVVAGNHFRLATQPLFDARMEAVSKLKLLINTGLQAGDHACSWRKAVFNGFSHATVLLSLIQKQAHISRDGFDEPRRG